MYQSGFNVHMKPVQFINTKTHFYNFLFLVECTKYNDIELPSRNPQFSGGCKTGNGPLLLRASELIDIFHKIQTADFAISLYAFCEANGTYHHPRIISNCVLPNHRAILSTVDEDVEHCMQRKRGVSSWEYSLICKVKTKQQHTPFIFALCHCIKFKTKYSGFNVLQRFVSNGTL